MLVLLVGLATRGLAADGATADDGVDAHGFVLSALDGYFRHLDLKTRVLRLDHRNLTGISGRV